MDNLEIRCSRCKAPIQHVCDKLLISAVRELQMFVVDTPTILFNKRNQYYEKGNEKTPFFSESFLYPLLGKENARTVLAAVNNVIRAAGIDPRSLQ